MCFTVGSRARCPPPPRTQMKWTSVQHFVRHHFLWKSCRPLVVCQRNPDPPPSTAFFGPQTCGMMTKSILYLSTKFIAMHCTHVETGTFSLEHTTAGLSYTEGVRDGMGATSVFRGGPTGPGADPQGQGWTHRSRGGPTGPGVDPQGQGWTHRARGGPTVPGVDHRARGGPTAPGADPQGQGWTHRCRGRPTWWDPGVRCEVSKSGISCGSLLARAPAPPSFRVPRAPGHTFTPCVFVHVTTHAQSVRVDLRPSLSS